MTATEETPLRAVFRECRSALVPVFVFSLFINLLVLTSPIYMMQMYDRVLASGRIETLIFLTLIAAVAVLVMGLLEMVRGRLLGRIGRWLEQKLAPDLIAVSMKGSLFGTSMGAQPLRDLASIRGIFGGAGLNAVLDAPWVPIFLAIIWLMHPTLGTIAFLSALALFGIAVLNELISRRPLRQASQLAIANTQRADAAIRNADVIHAMGMLQGFLSSWQKKNEQVLDHQGTANDRNATLVGFSKSVRMLVQILILGSGCYLVIQAELTPGAMIAASILLGRALAPVEQSIGAWRNLVAARDAYDRLKTLFERIPPAEEVMRLPAPVGRLSCEQVMFLPRGREQAVLSGITFALEPGEALGVIGPSAAGKSSLCKILVGTWKPSSGRARLDGADVFAWPSEELGAYIGYLPQDVELFAGTVKHNIARLSSCPDAEAVVEAARIAGVHEMVLRLPKGYDTEIGEGGSLLSGGQRQRLGLARALFGKPRLIVLDEPNASLDNEGEDALVAAIQVAKAWGATVVLVAHQPRILKPVDKLLLLRDGKMVTFGPRDEVLSKLRPLRSDEDTRPKAVPRRPPTPTPAPELAQS